MDPNKIHRIKQQLLTYTYPKTKLLITARTQQLRLKQ